MTTKKKLKINLKLIALIFIAVALVITGVRAYLFCTAYESDVHHFEYGNSLPQILNYILFAVTAVILVLMALVKKNVLKTNLGKTSTLTMVFAAATGIFAIAGGGYTINKLIMTPGPTELQDRAQIFGKIQAILSIAVFVYFVFTAFSKEKHVKIKSVFGLFSIIWHVVFIMAVYFDMNSPLNAPVKVMFQFGAMASMLYLVYEMRFHVELPKPRSYVAMSLISVTFLLVSCIPMFAGAIAGKMELDILDTLLCLQQLTMAGYVLSRLFTYLKDVSTVPFLEKEEKTETVNTVAQEQGE